MNLNLNPVNLLGYTSFSAAVLLGQTGWSQPVRAELPASVTKPASGGYVEFVASPLDQAAASSEDCGCLSSDMTSDQLGDLAIEQYGCDCAGCRNQMLRSLGVEPR